MASSEKSKISVLYVLDKSGFGGVQSIAYALMRHPFQDVAMHYLFLRNINSRFNMQEVGRRNVHYCRDRSRFSIVSFLTLLRLVHSEHIDVVHMNGNKAILYGALLKLCSPKLVLIAHDHGGVFDYKRWYRASLQCLKYVYCFFLCVSRRRKEFYLQQCHVPPSKIRIINNFFDAERFRTAVVKPVAGKDIAPGVFLIGYVGGLSHLKGCDVLLRALPKIQERLPQAKVTIAGDGPLRDQLENLVEELEISSSVTFLGYVDSPAEVYSDMDVMVIPSRAEEGPISLYEAWAMQIPVVASNAPVLDERIQHGETGVHFQSENSADLAEKIVLLAQNHTLAERIVKGGAEQVRPLTSAAYVRQLEKIYLDACSA